ncbi:MAG: hypothetical protein AABY22_19330 [Nanoarchaeota archaeon]
MDNIEETKQIRFNVKDIIVRNPRLETIIMVEEFIKKNSGEYKKTELFNNLPKKVMWGTFNVILKYLSDNNKIGMDKNGYILYIWNPELARKFINRKGY